MYLPIIASVQWCSKHHTYTRMRTQSEGAMVPKDNHDTHKLHSPSLNRQPKDSWKKKIGNQTMVFNVGSDNYTSLFSCDCSTTELPGKTPKWIHILAISSRHQVSWNKTKGKILAWYGIKLWSPITLPCS